MRSTLPAHLDLQAEAEATEAQAAAAAARASMVKAKTELINSKVAIAGMSNEQHKVCVAQTLCMNALVLIREELIYLAPCRETRVACISMSMSSTRCVQLKLFFLQHWTALDLEGA